VNEGTKDPQLIYWCERDVGGRYVQPYDPSIILADRVESDDGKIVWNGGSVWTKLNTRLHVFYTFHLEAPGPMVCIEPTYVKLPKVFS